jgi:hypothetical protein
LNRTGRRGQENKTIMMGLPGQDYQDRTTRTGLPDRLPGLGYQHMTAGRRQQGQYRKERKALEKDSQNRTGHAEPNRQN